MSITRIKQWLAVVIVVLAAHQAKSQQFDLGNMNPDFQFFAPAILDDFDESFPNMGWFATYERMAVYLSRPDTTSDEHAGDRTWGNRYDIGFMSEAASGWSFNFWHIDGPNANDVVKVERLNRLRVMFDPDAEPPQDNNNRLTRARDYLITDSINRADLSSWELNKTYRLEQGWHGATVEPFFGVRYVKFQDFFQHDNYERGMVVAGVPTFPDDGDLTNDDVERLTRLNSTFLNSIIGPQLGFRLFKKAGRWSLSADVRAFAGQNYQTFTRQTFIETTFGPATLDTATSNSTTQLITFRDSREEFVMGSEIRANTAYQIGRDVAMQFGLTWLEMYNGVGRGNDPDQNTQNVSGVVFSFGLSINR